MLLAANGGRPVAEPHRTAMRAPADHPLASCPAPCVCPAFRRPPADDARPAAAAPRTLRGFRLPALGARPLMRRPAGRPGGAGRRSARGRKNEPAISNGERVRSNPGPSMPMPMQRWAPRPMTEPVQTPPGPPVRRQAGAQATPLQRSSHRFQLGALRRARDGWLRRAGSRQRAAGRGRPAARAWLRLRTM